MIGKYILPILLLLEILMTNSTHLQGNVSAVGEGTEKELLVAIPRQQINLLP